MRFKKALLGLLAAVLLLAPLAGNGYIVLTRNEWVLPGAVADFDFVNGRYYDLGFVDVRKYFSVTRVSSTGTTATSLLPTSPSGYAYITYANSVIRVVQGIGLLTELVRTNYLLNSTAPATQTTGSLASSASPYTLWVNGSGGATMGAGTATGCGSSRASQGNPVSVTITVTGTCTVTVDGTLGQFQLELNATAASIPTSFIQTAGATAFRATDFIQFPTSGHIQALAASGAGTVMCQLTRPHPAIAASCFASTSGTLDRFITSGTLGGSFISVSHANVQITALDGGSPSDPTTDKVIIAWDGSGRCIVWNAGSPVCDTNTFAPAAPVFPFSTNGGINPSVPGKRLTFWSTRLSSATEQLLTK